MYPSYLFVFFFSKQRVGCYSKLNRWGHETVHRAISCSSDARCAHQQQSVVVWEDVAHVDDRNIDAKVIGVQRAIALNKRNVDAIYKVKVTAKLISHTTLLTVRICTWEVKFKQVLALMLITGAQDNLATIDRDHNCKLRGCV